MPKRVQIPQINIAAIFEQAAGHTMPKPKSMPRVVKEEKKR